jgi:hypothetical protein
MKSLKDYLIEAREYFNTDNITIEDIRILTQYGNTLRYGPDDEWLAVYNKIWPVKSMNPIAGWCLFTAYYTSKQGMGKHFTEDGARKLLDILKKQPLDRLEKILGAGAQGMVYDLGDNKVMKMFIDIPKCKLNYVLKSTKKMIGKQFSTLPTIYRSTSWYYIREGIIPGPKSKKCKKIMDTLSYENWPESGVYLGITGAIVGKDINSIDEFESKFRPIRSSGSVSANQKKEALQWLITCFNELKSINVELDSGFGDFRLDNLGETVDGRVVYHDLIY